jgi:hypothetical protein
MLFFNRRIGQKTIVTVPPSDKPTVIEFWTTQASAARVTTAYVAPGKVIIDREEIHQSKQRGEKVGASV